MVGVVIGIIVWNNYLNGFIFVVVIGVFYILIMVMSSLFVVMVMNYVKEVIFKD